MSLNFSISVAPRADKAKLDGSCPIYFFVKVGPAQPKKIHSGHCIQPQDWCKKKRSPKNTTGQLKALATYLNNEVSGFNKYMMEQKALGKPITMLLALAYFEKPEQVTLFSFWESRLEYWKGKKADATLKSYRSVLKLLKEFNRHLDFADINLSMIEKFDKYLEITRNNKLNGRFVKHKNFKSILSESVKYGYIKVNPYTNNFKIRSEDANRQALDLPELKQLMAFQIPEDFKRLELIKDAFLMACFTGLRYSDLFELKFIDLKSDGNRHWFDLTIRKTKRLLIIPLCKDALDLIEKYRNNNDTNRPTVFNYVANPQINRALKTLMEIAGIKKHISMHCARNTFATLHVDASTGLIQLRDLLGHRSVKQTETYSKLTGNDLFKSMNNLSSRLH